MTQIDGPRRDGVGATKTEPGEPRLGHLRFLRWMAERDRLEHRPLGPPSGRYAPLRRNRPTATWGGRYP
jgi:hypothetical protein